jgi:hypothetical protein
VDSRSFSREEGVGPHERREPERWRGFVEVLIEGLSELVRRER